MFVVTQHLFHYEWHVEYNRLKHFLSNKSSCSFFGQRSDENESDNQSNSCHISRYIRMQRSHSSYKLVSRWWCCWGGSIARAPSGVIVSFFAFWLAYLEACWLRQRSHLEEYPCIKCKEKRMSQSSSLLNGKQTSFKVYKQETTLLLPWHQNQSIYESSCIPYTTWSASH